MKKIDLLNNNFKISSKRKIFFSIPAVIVLIAIICMIIFNFTLGSPVNLGTDFTGGYSTDIVLGTRLTDENYGEFKATITDALSSVTAENGNTYSIAVDNFQRQGSDDDASIHIKYKAVASESVMTDEVNPAIKEKLESSILHIYPSITITGNVVKVVYNDVLTDIVAKELIQSAFDFASKNESITVNAKSDIVFNAETSNKTITINTASVTASETLTNDLIEALRIDDKYNGSVTLGSMVGATVSGELIFNAVLAVVLALMFMLSYIGIRFQLSSGLASIIALLHDIIITFSFMIIFHIEINSTFIAALITILGYSINNSIIIFDRIRENCKSIFTVKMIPEDVADKSVKETIIRTINTTITTLIMIVLIAIIGVSDIKIFAAPIIIGLLAGTYSSVCIAPSLWSLFQRVGKNRNNFPALGSAKNKKSPPAKDAA